MTFDLEEYLKKNVFIKMFLKGSSGSGKTFLASGATKIWKTYYIDVEGGIVSALKHINMKNVTVKIIKEKDNADFFNALGDAVAEASDPKYECVVVDSISEVASRMEEEYAKLGKKGKPPEFQDWYDLLGRMRSFARILRDMPCHTIITSLTKTAGKDGNRMYEPILPGQSATMVPSMFETIGLVQREAGKKHVLTTYGPELYEVRDRTNVLQAVENISSTDIGAIWLKLDVGLQSLLNECSPKKGRKKKEVTNV